MLSKYRPFILTAASVLALAGLGFFAFGRAGAAPEQGGPPMPVTVMTAEETAEQVWSEYSGRLDAVNYALLRPQVSGTVKEIRFQDGQMVKKDDILYVIDPAPYEAAAAQAEADLSTAKSKNLLAQKELARAKDLMKANAVSGTTVDERIAEASAAKNAVNSADAKLKQANIDLDYAYVKAPFDGRAGRAEITVGNVVQTGANAPVLTSVVSNAEIYADFDVDESTYLQHIRRLAQGPEAERMVPVKLTVRGDKAVVYDGTIHSFDNRINPDTGTIRARALFNNADGALLPGMFVSVKMGSSGNEKKILIPERAVGTDQDRKFVYVVGEGNKVMYREVKLGASVGESRVVLDGLKAGERVITEGLMKIRPDMVVAPQVSD